MNFKVDAKPEKKNITKDRLHESKKDTNQGESDKFDGNNLYFSSQADIPHYKTLLVSCNATICSLEISHFHCSLCNEESFTTLYQLKRHAKKTHFHQKHCVFYKSFICFPCKKDHIQPQPQHEKLIVTTVLSAASLSNQNLTF